MWKRLSHPNVVPFLGVHDAPAPLSISSTLHDVPSDAYVSSLISVMGYTLMTLSLVISSEYLHVSNISTVGAATDSYPHYPLLLRR